MKASSFFRRGCLWESTAVPEMCKALLCVFLGLPDPLSTLHVQVSYSKCRGSKLARFSFGILNPRSLLLLHSPYEVPRSWPAFSHHRFPLGVFTSPHLALLPSLYMSPPSLLPLTPLPPHSLPSQACFCPPS